MEDIVNRVAESGIITIDLEKFYPSQEIAVFDLKRSSLHGNAFEGKRVLGKSWKPSIGARTTGKSLQCIVQPMQLFRCGHSCF